MDQQAREQASITALTTEHFALQSTRSATIGSTREARRAGTHAASSATAASTIGTSANVTVSLARVS